ncbi:amino acid adenylation domain-containing protein [Streptomyces sp. NPDC020681]|uniref:amino acid adenylation domain-containing protein n=1 Tax=Streptomyces sp. NPDC020681 TaxID=3365083 RepID=UPI0037B5B499
MVLYSETKSEADTGGAAPRSAGPATGAVSVHGVFEQRVQETPGSVAVTSDGQSLTFRELDLLANRLAHRLAGLGVGPESCVGICAEPSPALVVAILGVLKAGAAYVPLDPHYPQERLTYLLQDSGADALITQSGLGDRLDHLAAPVVTLDPRWQDLADLPDRRPDVDVPADGAACMIYTSGSTGSPKGVIVTHRGLTNLASAAADEFGIRAGDRFLQLASIGFSAVLEEIFPPLLRGATVVLAGYRRALPSVQHFLDLLEREQVNGFEITTSYWHQLVDELAVTQERLPSSVRFVVMGGDRSRPDAVLAWRRSGVPLIHVYGPTEATATASYHHSEKESPDELGLLPIGRAIAGTQIHLLDPQMRLVPPGEVGEIFVGGAALARGYHGARAMTAQRFVPDPFGGADGRLYRTGDLGRELPDGTLEFLGRIDNQIKIRGFRIEPAEVEAALQRHSAVGQALVMLSADRSDDKHLVAYVRRVGEARPEAEELRGHLQAILPAHMIPARFLVLDEIPLTAHGKVDYTALERLAAATTPSAGGLVAPKPGIEAELAAIWAAVLKRDTVGATDEFLAMGGNSLQAARIVAEARRRFGVGIVLNDLLDERTVSALAAKIDRLRSEGPSPVPPPAEEEERKRWIDKRRLIERALAERSGEPRTSVISMSQQNLWILSRAAPEIPLYNESWQCRLRGELDRGAFDDALARIAGRHETVRTRFGMLDGKAVQIVGEAGTPIPLTHHDLTGLPAAEREPAARALRDDIIGVPLDPRQPPLLSVHLFQLADDEHLLLVHVHHLIFDGVSLEVFLDELAAFYRAHRTGSPVDLPELDFQYGDFALWQRENLKGDTLESLLGYWRPRLADPPTAELPTDRPVPAVQDHAGAKVLLPLPAGLREKVLAFARQENATPYMVLLTAMVVQLHRRTGDHDLCVGTPAANRLRSGIEPLIGCFINSLALRITLSPGMTYRQVLEQVRSTSLGAMEHQAMPFDKLVQELRPERRAGRSPYFQVWFATEDETALPRESEGLAFTDFQGMTTGLSTGISKMDVSWIVIDRGTELLLSLPYRTSLFDESTIRDMAVEYRTTLEDIVSQPEASAAAPAETVGQAAIVEHLLRLWRDAFGQQDIGPADDFFELGGYSMLAMELVNSIQEDFGIEVSFTDFFEASSVDGVAELIAASGAAGPGTAAQHAATGKSLDDILAEALAD